MQKRSVRSIHSVRSNPVVIADFREKLINTLTESVHEFDWENATFRITAIREGMKLAKQWGFTEQYSKLKALLLTKQDHEEIA